MCINTFGKSKRGERMVVCKSRPVRVAIIVAMGFSPWYKPAVNQEPRSGDIFVLTGL